MKTVRACNHGLNMTLVVTAIKCLVTCNDRILLLTQLVFVNFILSVELLCEASALNDIVTVWYAE